jgi:NTP pyrophosphatase (non-canonical NTP hydrolase)
MIDTTPEEYLKELEEISNDGDLNILLEFLAKSNDAKYNYTKVAEELNELSTVFLQKANKSKAYEPDLQEFIDEVGDVIWRMEVALGTLAMDYGIEEDELWDRVEKRIYKKTTGQLNNVKAGKYAHGR